VFNKPNFDISVGLHGYSWLTYKQTNVCAVKIKNK